MFLECLNWTKRFLLNCQKVVGRCIKKHPKVTSTITGTVTGGLVGTSWGYCISGALNSIPDIEAGCLIGTVSGAIAGRIMGGGRTTSRKRLVWGIATGALIIPLSLALLTLGIGSQSDKVGFFHSEVDSPPLIVFSSIVFAIWGWRSWPSALIGGLTSFAVRKTIARCLRGSDDETIERTGVLSSSL